MTEAAPAIDFTLTKCAAPSVSSENRRCTLAEVIQGD